MSIARPSVLLVAFVIIASSGAVALPVVEDSAVLNGEFELAAHAARGPACLLFGDSYVHVFDPNNGQGLPWLTAITPCHAAAVTAAHWSHGTGTLYADFDGDGDREAKVMPGNVDPLMGGHSMWQAYNSPHQAFTAGFDLYRFRVESGTPPSFASVIFSLSVTPLSDVTPWAGLWFDCQLSFRISTFQVANGVYSIDPTKGAFSSRSADCNDEAAAWAATTDPTARRAILSDLRVVQHSFWNFNGGSSAVVIDGVEIIGAPTAIESALE